MGYWKCSLPLLDTSKLCFSFSIFMLPGVLAYSFKFQLRRCTGRTEAFKSLEKRGGIWSFFHSQRLIITVILRMQANKTSHRVVLVSFELEFAAYHRQIKNPLKSIQTPKVTYSFCCSKDFSKRFHIKALSLTSDINGPFKGKLGLYLSHERLYKEQLPTHCKAEFWTDH